ncbi:MAG: HpcH/HpaI aldolase/citrate lyase family protein [Gammaproteobacteria bacterium]|nr:HpcH/HpaI aldolase/citrate lyase family protein [Gammaproteobacteria bacterium]
MSQPMPSNLFKQQLAAGELQLGAFLGLADAYSAEVMASTDFDWLLIDGEHGPNDVRTILAQLQVLAAYPVSAVVRPADHNTATIKQLLDIGAQSLMIPMVESAEQAEQLVQAMRYPPAGIRGVGAGMARAARWNGVPGYLNRANDNLCLVAQIESSAGLVEIEAIAAVDGVDGLFLGPADLAAEMGYLGQPGHIEVRKAIEIALPKIRAAGKAAGIYCSAPEVAESYRTLGATFLLIGADTMLLRSAADAHLKRFRL